MKIANIITQVREYSESLTQFEINSGCLQRFIDAQAITESENTGQCAQQLADEIWMAL